MSEMGEIDEDKPADIGSSWESDEPPEVSPVSTSSGDEEVFEWDEWIEPLDLTNVPNRPVGRRRGYRDAYEKSRQRYSSKRRLPSIPESKSPEVAIEAEEALENGEVVTSREEDDGSHVTRVNVSQVYEHSINVDEIDFKMARGATGTVVIDAGQGLGLPPKATQNGTSVHIEDSESSEGNSSSPFWDAKRKNRGCRALVVILVIFGISLSSVAVWLAVTTIQEEKAEGSVQSSESTTPSSNFVMASHLTTSKLHFITNVNLLALPTFNKHFCDVISKYSSTDLCAMYDNIFRVSELSPSYDGCSHVEQTSDTGSIFRSRLRFLNTIREVTSSPARAVQLLLENEAMTHLHLEEAGQGLSQQVTSNLTCFEATTATRTKAFTVFIDGG